MTPRSVILCVWAVACDAVHDEPAPAEDTDPVVDSPDETDAPPDTDVGETAADVPATCGPGVAAQIGASAFGTVQDALNASQPGDTVQVCPGVHPGGLYCTHPGPLTIVGDPADPGRVVLDGGGIERVLYCGNYAEELRLEGLTIRDGWVPGSWFDPFTGIQSGSVGGGLTGYFENLYVYDCVFENNEAIDFGTMQTLGGAMSVGGQTIDIRSTRFLNNRSYGGGGCLSISLSSRLSILDSDLSGCETNNNGGAVSLYVLDNSNASASSQPIEVQFERVSFVGNAGGQNGTVLSVYKRNPFRYVISLDATFTDVQFIDNRADMGWDGDYHMYGEGTVHIYSEGGGDVVRFERALFSGNQAYSLCGIYAWAHRTREPVYPAPRLEVRNSTFLPCVPSPYDEGTHLYVQDHWSAIYENVDVGSGPTANPGGDFGQCREETDGVVSGEVHPLLDDWCP